MKYILNAFLFMGWWIISMGVGYFSIELAVTTRSNYWLLGGLLIMIIASMRLTSAVIIMAEECGHRGGKEDE